MGKYSGAHVSPTGAGDARPTALEIVKDNDLEGKLIGKTIVVTGTSSGQGIETARALSTTGATLLLTHATLEQPKRSSIAFWSQAACHW